MAIVYECPSCGKKLKIPDGLVGKQVRCSDCAGTFVAERAHPAPPPVLRNDPHAIKDQPRDEFDDRPTRRRRRHDGLEAHRGGLIMAFGIISLVLVLLSGGVYVGGTAVTGILGVAGLPVTIIGLVLGILAWIWGGSDMTRMSMGIMDPAGRGMTQAGYICGIIGTILNSFALIFGCIAAVMAMLGVAAIGCCLFSAAANAPPPNRPFPPPQPPRRFEVPSPRLPDYLPQR